MCETTKYYLFLLPLWGLLMACNPKATSTLENTSKYGNTDEVAMTKSEAFEVSSPQKIAGIKKTACYGECPVFEVTFYSDGKVIWEGKRFTDKIGRYTVQLPKAEITNIIQKGRNMGYFAFNDSYPKDKIQMIPDLPNTVTFLSYANEFKQVINNYDAPTNLKNFEAYLLDICNSIDWEKSN